MLYDLLRQSDALLKNDKVWEEFILMRREVNAISQVNYLTNLLLLYF